MVHTQRLRTAASAPTGDSATSRGYIEHALPMMPRSASQREALRRSVTIDSDNLKVLFRARYFLAGVLIGAALWLPLFLAME